MPKEPIRPETGAEAVAWNLSDLHPSETGLNQGLTRARQLAIDFAGRYRDKVAEMPAAELGAALQEFEAIQDLIDRAYTFVFLDWSTNTEDSKRGALLQRVREQYTEISQLLIFFEVELIHTTARLGQPLIQHPELRRYRHYLEMLALRKDHVLSEAEEKILAEKAVSGSGAWCRFFDETLGAARFRMDDGVLTEQEVLAKLYDPDRETRSKAALAFTRGLRENLRTLTFVFNTLLGEKASDDRMRNFKHWLASRNLSNEISDEAVESLVSAVTERFDLVARYYRLKKKLLGLEELYDYDRYAPLDQSDSFYTWDRARNLVVSAYRTFAPSMGEIAERFFEESWIDASVRGGKRGGAFSHRAVPQVHPYILMNFTGNIRDVQTLAHELGHGVHQYLARKQGSLQAGTPLTTAEMASVFGEMLVFDHLLEQESDPRRRLSLLVSKIDDSIATVFRQISMNRFEDRLHRARREEGELSIERFSDFWVETQSAMFQGSVTLSDHYRIWWSYIPHFVHTPGYVYAYAFGELLVMALYSMYRSQPEGFAGRYLQVLEAGGSDWPHNLLSRMGVDLRDPEFWRKGLQEIEELITQAEKLSDTNPG